MQKKLRKILNSVVTVAACASLIVGSTFALFTSETKTDIAVTSAKVQVTSMASVSGAWSARALESGGYEENRDLDKIEGGYRFANGGVVTYDGTDTVTIAGMSPGDGAEVTIQTRNDSTIRIRYETVVTLLSEDTTLFEGLELKINEEPVNKELRTAVSNWKTPVYEGGADDGRIDDIKLHIALPIDADNRYMTNEGGEPRTCELAIAIYAVQANGHDDTYQNVVLIKDSEHLIDHLESAQPGDVLAMDPGEYEVTEDVVLPTGVNLVGKQKGVPASEWATDPDAEKTVIKVSDDYVASETNDKVLEILQDGTGKTEDVVLDGIMVDCNEKNVKGIYVKKTGGDAMEGIEIVNCAVVNTENDGIDVSNTNGAIIENNYVEGVTDNGIRLGNYKNSDGNTACVCGNVIENVNGTLNGAIAVTEGKGDVVVSGNIIKNVTSGHEYHDDKIGIGESAITVEKLYEGGTVIIEDNTLENVEQGIGVYKFSATDADSKVIIRNNTISNYKVFAIATGTLHYKTELSALTCVEITGNTITCEAEQSGSMGPIFVERTNRYNETTSGWSVTASGNTYNGSENYLEKPINGTFTDTDA